MKTLDYTAHVSLPFGASCRIAEDMLPLCNASTKDLLETIIDTKQELRFVQTKYLFLLESLELVRLCNDSFATFFNDEVSSSLEEYYSSGLGEFADEILEDLDLKVK